MAKIAIAIMLIFIASTHCELRDCSKEELDAKSAAVFTTPNQGKYLRFIKPKFTTNYSQQSCST